MKKNLRKTIKRVLNEALGVPEGILHQAKRIYDDFVKEFIVTLENDPSDLKFNITITPDEPYKVGSIQFTGVEVEIEIYPTEQVTETQFARLAISGVGDMDFSGVSPKIINITSKTIELLITIAVPETWDISMVTDFLKSKHPDALGSFAHELKHEYDKFNYKGESVYNRGRYKAAQELIAFPGPLRDFAYNIYYSSNIENSVKLSQVAMAMKEEGITKKDFLNFLKNNKDYTQLKKMKEFTLDKLKLGLHEKMSEIDEFLIEVLGAEVIWDLSDDEKVNKILELFQINFIHILFNASKTYLTDTNIFRNMLKSTGRLDVPEEERLLDEKKERWLDNLVEKLRKYDGNVNKFFEFEEKLFKLSAIKMSKKIAKLYDMAEDDDIKSESIHNPAVYVEVDGLREKIINELKEIVEMKKKDDPKYKIKKPKK